MRKHLIVISLIFSISSFSQSLDFGIRNQASYTVTTKSISIFPIDLNLCVRSNILEYAIIKMSLGYAYESKYYSGVNYNLLFETEFYKSCKLIIGVNFHGNIPDAHGTSSYSEIYGKTFRNFVTGTGINLNEKTSIDLLLFYPFENEIGYYHSVLNSGEEKGYYKLNYIIKIGFEKYF